MDESVEQTSRIHERQRLMRTEAGLELTTESGSHRQEALERSETLGASSRRDSLCHSTERFLRPGCETRRDHARFLNLIEVSAFLHQYQREKKSGAIVATVEDYAVAYQLASPSSHRHAF